MATLAHNTQGQLFPDYFVGMIGNASAKYGVPPAVLTGVFGMETDYGKDVRTSSTGAVGYMQFEPATASAYGYPLTNNPTATQAQQQFNAAAKYLSTLHKQYGTWNAALQHYSGGGYGLPQVEAKAQQKVSDGIQPAGISLPSLPGISSLGDVWNSVVGDAKYAAVLVGALLLGALLIFHGVSGGHSSPKIVPVPV